MRLANENRIVDAEFQAQRRPDFRWNIAVGGELAERISRGEREQDKKNETDAEQAGNSDDQTSENVFSHRSSAVSRSGFAHRRS
jgi:hypothetical protein